MSILILSLLIISAIFHSGWNLLLKQSGERMIALWWALVISAVISLPLLIGTYRSMSIATAWPYILASSIFEVAYFVVLVQAYRIGDFSMVYPVARGFAPALLAIWSIVFLGEQLRFFGALGIILIVAGLMVVGSSAWFTSTRSSPSLISITLALLVAVCISIYSIIDGTAVKSHPPIPYAVSVFIGTAIILTPFVTRHYGLAALSTGWKLHWRRILLIGLLTTFAYLLVLVIYSIAKVSYAGAIREVGIVFAALAGWLLLKEELGKIRIIGAAIVFAGIFLIAFKG